MNHRGHVELDHLLVERIPPAVGERRIGPIAAGRIGVEVAADEAELVDAALELCDAVGRRHARRLRQLADADEVSRVERADAMDQVVADARSMPGSSLRRRVVRHAGRARREDRHVGAALALELELRALEALADFVVGDADVRRGRPPRRVRRAPTAGDRETHGACRRGRVVAVAVDDHLTLICKVDGGRGLRRSRDRERNAVRLRFRFRRDAHGGGDDGGEQQETGDHHQREREAAGRTP